MKRLAILLLIVASPCFGQTISGVAGNVADGNNIVISGSGFGFKGQAAPLRWSDFQEGTPGDGDTGRHILRWEHGGFASEEYYVNAESTYVSYQATHGRYDGDVCAMMDYSAYTYPNRSSGGYGIGLPTGTDVDTLYVSAWMYVDSFDGSFWTCRNYKALGQWSTQGLVGNAARQSRTDCYPLNGTNSSIHFYVEAWDSETPGTTAINYNDGSPITNIPVDRWGRIERGMMQGRPSQNGYVFLTIDGERVGTISGHSFFETGAAEDAMTYNWFYLSRYFARDTTPAPECRIYWSSIYADSTMARVEIGDSQNYDTCTVRETLIPSAWSATSITAEVYNPVAFAEGSSAYIFVADRRNNISAGYPVTIGIASGSEGAPGRPQNLTVHEN